MKRLRIYKTAISKEPEKRFLELVSSGEIPAHSQCLGVLYSDGSMYYKVSHPAFAGVAEGEDVPTFSVRGA